VAVETILEARMFWGIVGIQSPLDGSRHGHAVLKVACSQSQSSAPPLQSFDRLVFCNFFLHSLLANQVSTAVKRHLLHFTLINTAPHLIHHEG
jgi:hypothetical protein